MSLTNKEKEEVEFTIKCKMNRRWADQFMSFLKMMQSYGNMGCSRRFGFYCDGDGDFHPTFETDFKWEKQEPAYTKESDIAYEEKAIQEGWYNTHCAYNEYTYDAG